MQVRNLRTKEIAMMLEETSEYIAVECKDKTIVAWRKSEVVIHNISDQNLKLYFRK